MIKKASKSTSFSEKRALPFKDCPFTLFQCLQNPIILLLCNTFLWGLVHTDHAPVGVGVTQGRFTFQTLTPMGYYRNFWVGMYRRDPGTLNLYQSYNLGQNTMEQQTPIPHPQIKDEAARRAKTRHFPILDLGGRGGGLGFPFILSKIIV